MNNHKYQSIHSQLGTIIQSGEYQIGDRLPSERELSKSFGVSMATVRQALGLLEQDGTLGRRISILGPCLAVSVPVSLFFHPFVETIRRYEASSALEGGSEGWLFTQRLTSGIYQPRTDGSILCPKRKQSPLEHF